jgi:putative transposase
VVGVTRQGFYAWKRRPPNARELADRELAERIKQIYFESEEIYGAPRIYSELKLGDGIQVGKKRVARVMRQPGIRGADGRRGGYRTTVRDPKRSSAPAAGSPAPCPSRDRPATCSHPACPRPSA